MEKRVGFSLVELSIVLVILGLLVGGVLSGQSLIRAAELRAITTEYQRYVAAKNTFKDKYFALPGDMSNATQFWGYTGAPVSCVNKTGAATTSTGTCDGDGNGMLTTGGPVPSSVGEGFLFWQHLAKAGLIEGNYTPISGSTWGQEALIGTNSPASRLPSAGWSTDSGMNSSSGPYGNTLIYGAKDDLSYYFTAGPALTPQDAWNIDTKMDDGKPTTGKAIGFYNTYYGCATGDTIDDSTITYVLTQTTKSCSFIFRHALD